MSVAVLDVVAGLSEAPNKTLPNPVPGDPLRIVTHAESLVAVQPHPPVVVTVIVPLPPANPTG